MSAVKQIQCPACGASSTFKQTDGSYRCNYCQSTFELKDDPSKDQKNKDLRELIQSKQKLSKEDVLKAIQANQPAIASAGKKLGCVISIFALVLFAGISFFIFFTVNKSMKESGIDMFSDWQKPSLNIYQSFVGSKGPVIWEISQQTRNKLDSAKYSIEIIDPQTKSVLAGKPVFETMTWTESFNFSKMLDGQFFQMGDIAYNCSEENGLIGYNIYDFSEEVTEETLGKKYPELTSGISKASFMWYKKAFNITTNKGDEFVYYPETNLLRTKKKDDNSYRSDTLTDTKVYLSSEKQARLFLIRRRGDKTRDELDINDRIANDYDKQKGFYKSSYHISQFKQINERVFFKSQPLLRINGALVFVYVDDLSKKAKVHLECVSQDGKTVWINSDEVLQELKKSTGDNLSFEYRHNNEFITISLWGAKRKTHCFDLKTGKLVWSYSPEK